MHLDVTALRDFYALTALGRGARALLSQKLASLWPSVKGETVVGYGFASPLLDAFLPSAARVLNLMPAQQGVVPWPEGQPGRTALVEETLWPIANNSVDRLVVAHGLETCERPSVLLEEMWRVMAPAGKIAMIVPNRVGMWARRDVTPFGYGRPYSTGQLERTLSEHRFTVERQTAALYGPPSSRAFWLKTAMTAERIGQRLEARRLAGVGIVEATKTVAAQPRSGAKVAAREPLRVLEGLAPVPAPKPVAGRNGPLTFTQRRPMLVWGRDD